MKTDNPLPRRFFDAVSGFILLLDPDGVIANITREGAGALGYERAELIGRDWFTACLPPASQDAIREVFATTIKEGVYPSYYENPVLTKEGTEKVFSWHNTVVYQSDGETIAGVLCTANDATLRRAYEKELRQSEARYRQIFEKNKAVQLLIDPDTGRILEANPAAADFYGYDLETFARLNITDLNTLSPAEIHEEMTHAREQRRHTFYFSHRLANGDIRNVLVHSSPIKVGDVAYLHSIVHDITPLNMAEANLEAVLDATAVSFTFIDPDYRIVLTNRLARERSRRVFGVEAAPGMDIRNFVRAQDYDSFIRHFQQALAGEMIQVELSLAGQRGDSFCYEFIYYPVMIDNGVVNGVCLTTSDITARRQAETALQESEEQFRQLAEHIQDVFWLFDVAERKLLYVNPAVAQLWQRPYADILADPAQILDAIHPDDGDVVNAIIDALLEPDPDQDLFFENRLLLPSGEARRIRSRFFPVRDEEGLVYRLAGITTDVTGQYKARQQAIALALERERVNLLAGFMKSASHEFRTPLAIIETYVSLLSRLTEPDKRREKIAGVKQQVRRLTTLVNSLLLMAQLDATNTVAAVPVDLNQLLHEIAAARESEIEEKALAIDLHLAASLPPVPGERRLLEQAVDALWHNAIRHTPAGETITVKTAVSATTVTLTIRDSGPGIHPDDKPHIFERFFRADKSHATTGFGLGLPIAKRVIELHQGDITVDSQPGEGVLVIVALPRERESGLADLEGHYPHENKASRSSSS